MKSVHEFARLAKINIPVEADWAYYVDLMDKLPSHAGIKVWAEEFSRFESESKVLPSKIKMQIFDKMKTAIGQTKAYARFQAFPMETYDGFPERKFNGKEGVLYASIDISKANWTVMKIFDSNNELPETWDEYCVKFELPAPIARSKSFRQLLFGNLNPTRNGNIQKRNMTILANYIAKYWEVNSFSNDEFTIVCPDAQYNFWAQAIVRASMEAENLKLQISPNDLKVKFFTVKLIGDGTWVKNCLEFNREKGLTPTGSVLVKVPGNEYYMYLKAFILNEPILDKDRLFVVDDKLAQWTELPAVIRRHLEAKNA